LYNNITLRIRDQTQINGQFQFQKKYLLMVKVVGKKQSAKSLTGIGIDTFRIGIGTFDVELELTKWN